MTGVQTCALPIFSRGDRRLSKALLRAWELGCKNDAWSEEFSLERWLQAFEDTGLDPEFYANRRIGYEEVLPWDHISAGVDKGYLIEEAKKAEKGLTTQDCRFGKCERCGVCMQLDVTPVLASGRKVKGVGGKGREACSEDKSALEERG